MVTGGFLGLVLLVLRAFRGKDNAIFVSVLQTLFFLCYKDSSAGNTEN